METWFYKFGEGSLHQPTGVGEATFGGGEEMEGGGNALGAGAGASPTVEKGPGCVTTSQLSD